MRGQPNGPGPGAGGGAELAEGWTLLDGRDDDDYELWASERYGEIVGAESAPARRPLLVRTRKRYYVDPAVEPASAGLPLRDWSRRFKHERTRGWLVSRRQDQLSLPLPGLRGDGRDGVGDLSSEAPEI